jgi:hypothetical protein
VWFAFQHERAYKAYVDMLAKCEGPCHPKDTANGGKGVTVSEQRRKSFRQFLAEMVPMTED